MVLIWRFWCYADAFDVDVVWFVRFGFVCGYCCLFGLFWIYFCVLVVCVVCMSLVVNMLLVMTFVSCDFVLNCVVWFLIMFVLFVACLCAWCLVSSVFCLCLFDLYKVGF